MELEVDDDNFEIDVKQSMAHNKRRTTKSMHQFSKGMNF